MRGGTKKKYDFKIQLEIACAGSMRSSRIHGCVVSEQSMQ